MFGVVALLGSAGDRRMIRAGGLRGAPRLVRHLWRMCFALFIASIAFYLGPGRVPEALRIPALLAGAVLVPIVAMLYWLWRLRVQADSSWHRRRQRTAGHCQQPRLIAHVMELWKTMTVTRTTELTSRKTAPAVARRGRRGAAGAGQVCPPGGRAEAQILRRGAQLVGDLRRTGRRAGDRSCGGCSSAGRRGPSAWAPSS